MQIIFLPTAFAPYLSNFPLITFPLLLCPLLPLLDLITPPPPLTPSTLQVICVTNMYSKVTNIQSKHTDRHLYDNMLRLSIKPILRQSEVEYYCSY